MRVLTGNKYCPIWVEIADEVDDNE